jgi:hypothetical protein
MTEADKQEDIEERIMNALAIRPMTQTELAQKCGVKRQHIHYHVHNGKKVAINVIQVGDKYALRPPLSSHVDERIKELKRTIFRVDKETQGVLADDFFRLCCNELPLEEELFDFIKGTLVADTLSDDIKAILLSGILTLITRFKERGDKVAIDLFRRELLPVVNDLTGKHPDNDLYMRCISTIFELSPEADSTLQKTVMDFLLHVSDRFEEKDLALIEKHNSLLEIDEAEASGPIAFQLTIFPIIDWAMSVWGEGFRTQLITLTTHGNEKTRQVARILLSRTRPMVSLDEDDTSIQD